MSMSVLKITKNNFEEEVMKSNVPVLLDFWAEWCGPCRMLGPVVEEIAQETQGTIKVGKVNIDEEADLATSFKVMSIPTLVVIKNGKLTATSVGVKPKQDILNMLK